LQGKNFPKSVHDFSQEDAFSFCFFKVVVNVFEVMCKVKKKKQAFSISPWMTNAMGKVSTAKVNKQFSARKNMVNHTCKLI